MNTILYYDIGRYSMSIFALILDFGDFSFQIGVNGENPVSLKNNAV